MSGSRPLRELLRSGSVDQVCMLVDPGGPHGDGRNAQADALEARPLKLDQYAAWRAQQRRPLNDMISRAPQVSDSPSPFVLDRPTHASMWKFRRRCGERVGCGRRDGVPDWRP